MTTEEGNKPKTEVKFPINWVQPSKDILIGNELIGRYMGLGMEYQMTNPPKPDGVCRIGNVIQPIIYHESWSWLMPVVLKILKETDAEFEICTGEIVTHITLKNHKNLKINTLHHNPILAVWQAVVNYLKNKQQ